MSVAVSVPKPMASLQWDRWEPLEGLLGRVNQNANRLKRRDAEQRFALGDVSDPFEGYDLRIIRPASQGDRYDVKAATKPTRLYANGSNTRALGQLIYTDYVYAFEIAAVILLVAIVAAIALTLRHRKTAKYQNSAQQIGVRRQDRIRIVSMPSEKK